jgi:hypothetical protein
VEAVGCGGSAIAEVVAYAVVLFTVIVLPWGQTSLLPIERKEKVMRRVSHFRARTATSRLQMRPAVIGRAVR